MLGFHGNAFSALFCCSYGNDNPLYSILNPQFRNFVKYNPKLIHMRYDLCICSKGKAAYISFRKEENFHYSFSSSTLQLICCRL